MPMSATDRYTQSQTRLRKSAIELNAATAQLRRNAADAHLAATGTAIRIALRIRRAMCVLHCGFAVSLRDASAA